MIKWSVNKKIKEPCTTIRMRVHRRMDAMAAIEFLNGVRIADNIRENYTVSIPEQMYVQGIGFVVLEEYMMYLENGIEV